MLSLNCLLDANRKSLNVSAINGETLTQVLHFSLGVILQMTGLAGLRELHSWFD